MENLAENLQRVRAEITAAQNRVGRDDHIELIAVTKYASTEQVRELTKLGVRKLGENRVQELIRKNEQLADHDLKWHMVGHLQRNKVKKVLPLVELIHSLDSVRLAREINKRAGCMQLKVKVLVQVNIARDENKYGIAPTEVRDFIEEVSRFPHLQIAGLMTLVPYIEDPEQARPYFRSMCELFDELREEEFDNTELTELSMGMTNDFQIAVEEGATMVRIGSALFGNPY